MKYITTYYKKIKEYNIIVDGHIFIYFVYKNT